MTDGVHDQTDGHKARVIREAGDGSRFARNRALRTLTYMLVPVAIAALGPLVWMLELAPDGIRAALAFGLVLVGFSSLVGVVLLAGQYVLVALGNPRLFICRSDGNVGPTVMVLRPQGTAVHWVLLGWPEISEVDYYTVRTFRGPPPRGPTWDLYMTADRSRLAVRSHEGWAVGKLVPPPNHEQGEMAPDLAQFLDHGTTNP